MPETLFDDVELGEPVPAWEQLRRLAPPPLVPTAIATLKQWQELERSIGLAFPQDFKCLMDAYGVGCFGGFLWMFHPFYQWKHPQGEDNYLRWARKRMESLTIGQQIFPECSVPFATYPATGGLLPWGFTDNGDTLCWQTVGISDKWPLVFIDSKGSERYYYFPMTVTEFLLRWLNQQVHPQIFPDDMFQAEKPLFQSMHNV